ncbi:hypothetical protein [Kribbella sp. CA-293567]|uniref:hypothetical protein n=1 Tax=Kribbella sp. CA-293567 TaxID=3002436 RepID=UPI0022DDA68B|nr:hypothetical protein [Kribbella sp. CA-293567]WBQ08543.1 hypothetical protein OX958_17415 [Kribbella sp. CA-293567]
MPVAGATQVLVDLLGESKPRLALVGPDGFRSRTESRSSSWTCRKTGPVEALISNGYFSSGLTGGNSDIQNVPVRGYDAQGKKVYDAKHAVDAGAGGR